MYCMECGTDLPEGAKFCRNCGANLEAQTAKTNPRKEALALFKGPEEQRDEPRARVLLEQAAAEGDALAAMWIARCLYLGRCTYDKDESRALALAEKAHPTVHHRSNTGDKEAVYLAAWYASIQAPPAAPVAQDNAASSASSPAPPLQPIAPGTPATPDAPPTPLRKPKSNARKILKVVLVPLLLYIAYTSFFGADPAKGQRLYDEAQALHDAGHYSEAADSFAAAAKNGNVPAMKEMAARTLDQPKEHAAWNRKAAEAGDGNAMYRMYQCYTDGFGVTADDDTAFDWLLRAGEEGVPDACIRLGQEYFSGDDSQDDREAAKWFQRGAENGDAMCMYLLSVMYDEGWGVPQNDDTSVDWLIPAAEAGYPDAMCDLGIRYFYGEGISQNEDKARAWCERAADMGHEKAQEALDRWYL